ncbi:hypothetical protein KKG16_00865, partial [Patescibacteria group bacterium]|nr:hypothetical protein [Patescibacteria group bacterium]
MDTLQGDWQHYSGATAIGYGGFVDCDDNVYKWAGRRISSLANGRKVLDVGCGKCGRLPYFSGARSFVGVEAGQDMVDQIPDDAGVSITRWNGDSGSLGKEIQKSPKLVIHGDMQDVCESEVIRASIASSLFSVICFPDPVVPFKAISAGLKPGGRVVVVSNAMVPSDLGIDDTQSYSGLDVDLQNGVDNIKLP